MTESQLKILVFYAEQDINDNSRQATAFNLLKVILRKKVDIPELFQVIQKVSDLSIVSESPNVRLHSRQVVHKYIMDYPLKLRELEKFIAFFVSQLNYQVQSGRQSALETVLGFITHFPMVINQPTNNAVS